MRAFKNVTLFIAATIVAVLLIRKSIESFGFGSPILALVINWLLMCCIACASLIVRLPLPSAYYDIKAFECRGLLYERARIRVWRRFLRRGPLRILSPDLRLPQKITLEGLREVERRMRRAEAIHVFALLIALLPACYGVVRGLSGTVWILLFNLAINVYPIMLQRYNRIKLEALMRKQAA